MFLLTTSPSNTCRLSRLPTSRLWSYDYLYKPLSIEAWTAHIAHTIGIAFERSAPANGNEIDWPEWKRQNAMFQQKWNGSETAHLWDTIQLDSSKVFRMKEAHRSFLETISHSLPTYVGPQRGSLNLPSDGASLWSAVGNSFHRFSYHSA